MDLEGSGAPFAAPVFTAVTTVVSKEIGVALMAVDEEGGESEDKSHNQALKCAEKAECALRLTGIGFGRRCSDRCRVAWRVAIYGQEPEEAISCLRLAHQPLRTQVGRRVTTYKCIIIKLHGVSAGPHIH